MDGQERDQGGAAAAPPWCPGGVGTLAGDSLAVLAAWPDACVDAVVTDPPYGLVEPRSGGQGTGQAFAAQRSEAAKEARRGFMGMAWDKAVPPAALWAQVLRVLKPGGHLLAFFGTRTYHRGVVEIEDAGFDVRDQLAWVYGCLTDDAEILTETGWRRHADIKVGDRVVAWKSAEDALELQEVQEVIRAPYSGDMVRFRNDNTDQLLTPNHRVYKRHRQRKMVAGVRTAWFEESWSVAEAGAINRWEPIRLPLASSMDGPGVGGTDYAALLGWVWTEGGFDRHGTGVRISQSSVNPENVAEISDLLAKLIPGHKLYKRDREYKGRTYTEYTWFFTGDMAKRVRTDLPGKHPTWALLWRLSLAEKVALRTAAMRGDGSGMAFHQKNAADLEWFQALAHATGWQCRINLKRWAVSCHANPTTELQAKHLKDASAPYAGTVWCVRVPAGAFVARRNGKVFITGNSGFPKSLDVSKAIDKKLGGQRATKRLPPRNAEGTFSGSADPRPWVERSKEQGYHEVAGDEPATPEAARWQGWGTALKPAWEPIVLARKPPAGTVAGNVLEHGTGGLHIDACRVPAEARPHIVADRGKSTGNTFSGGQDGSLCGSRAAGTTTEGRWPANLAHDGSPEVLENFPASSVTGRRSQESMAAAAAGTAWLTDNHQSREYTDAGSAARFFYCAKASRRERGPGNNHPTVKPLALMRWLVRLVTPPGGFILDPFCGSGTTLLAALAEGMRAVGIDREPAYLEIVASRLAAAAGGPAQPDDAAGDEADDGDEDGGAA